MSNFIKRPNPTVKNELEINTLKAEVRLLQAQLKKQECLAEEAQTQVTELESDCPDCSNICKLEADCEDAACDVAEIQRLLVDELACGAKMPRRLCAKGLEKELCLVTEIVQASLCEAELKTAIANYTLAYCHAANVPPYVAERKELLDALIECNPDIDERCLNFISKAMLCACA